MRLPYVAVLAAFVVLSRALPEKRQVAGPTCVLQDIVYMVDSSSYVGSASFLQQLQFIKDNIQYYNLDPQCTRISIVTYSSRVTNQFYLNGYTSQAELYNAIDNIQYQPGAGSNTYDALNYVYKYSFTAEHGGRTGIPHYGILVTGSTSSDSSLTVNAANQARQNGMNLFTVGVGNGVSQGELNSVSSSEKNMFTAQNYNSLNTVAEPLATRINGAVTPSTSQVLGDANSCLQQADIVFLVDGSGSIGSANFIKLENFVKGIVGKLDVGQDTVHVGLVQFSNYPRQEFPLNMYTSRQDVMSAIDQISYMGGGTNTADGIKYVHEQVYSATGGARQGVPRITVVITDGQSANPTQTATEANNARQDNIGLLAVGVGNGVDINELNNIADDPDASNTFTVSNYDELDSIATQIINRACTVKATAPPPTAAGSEVGALGPETCFNNISDCEKYDKSVCGGDYFLWAKDNCPRYCNYCTPLYPDPSPPCVDALTNCHEYQADSCVGDFKGWAVDNCRKYCGYCDATEQSIGFYGKCFYKGQPYDQGETWDDGCDYQCTCMDGSKGNYQCYNKCPVYYDLPAQCTLVKSNSQCCLQPVCDFNAQINNIESTSLGQTTDGVSVCDYKGQLYYQGQTWTDGCDYTCSCEDATTGRYKCQTLCPTYSSIPSYCHLEKPAGECCAKPACEFKTNQGSFSGTGTISGQGVSIVPTPPPNCVDNLPDCDRYDHADVCVNYIPWAKDNCRAYCGLCGNGQPEPTATDVCIYEGRAFHQGESWMTGCDTTCICENAVYGYYRCVNSCPKYNNLPSTCQEVKKDGDCCTSVECQSGTGTFVSSTGNLASIGNGGLIMEQGQVVPTLPSGNTPQPGTGGTGNSAPTLEGCLYKGNVYISGQMWDDGCQYTCTCMDADQGYYTCRAKCPEFPSLPSTCTLEVNPDDECCMRAKCDDPSTPVIPVFKPGTSGQNVVEPPKANELYQGTQTIPYSFTIGGGSGSNTPTANPNVSPGTGIGYCEYNDQRYQQGESWEDGCMYNCICEDASIGFYRCLERCPTFPALPDICKLVTDPNDACCQIVSCDVTGVINTVTNQSQASTANPTVTNAPATNPPVQQPKFCVYKDSQYSQGQQWFDGCDKKCVCNDAEAGFYTCSPRCAEFFNVPDSCTYVPDPNDPGCCQVPQCIPTPPPGSTLSPDAIPTIAPGTYSGQSNSTSVGYCVYKGQQYHQGDRWDDGCDFTCVCEDAEIGKYKCTDKCPSYGALPAGCVMVTDFANPCCKKPSCDFTGTYGEITGTLTPAPGQTNAPGINPSGAPTARYCVYKNAQYSQGQTWNDGCQYRCRCDDASKGLYVCDNRCPEYPSLPDECHMVTDPSDTCCQKPECNFTPSTGEVTGTASPYLIPTQIPGVITGQANTPAPTPGSDGSTQAPMPLSYCEYKGSQYSEGQTWDDSCDYTCVCIDASLGKYQCNEKCPQYNSIPSECHMVKDAANPCCFKPVCDFTPSTGEITGQGTTLVPLPGQTAAPNPNPNPYPNPNVNPTSAPLPKEVCVYRQSEYTQGQQWFDDCDYKCTCEDAEQGIYRCNQRCASYQSGLPEGCSLVADPADPLCCKVPSCVPQTNSSAPYPTIPTGHVTGGSVTLAPQPVTTVAPVPGQTTLTPNPNATPAPEPKAVCVYKGKEYSEGQRWRDGCDYNCECVDGMTGLYDCTEICPKYTNLPDECHLEQDFNQPCCQKPVCDFTPTAGSITGQGTTMTPLPGQTNAPTPGTPENTPAPTPKKLCSYNGVLFRQGDRWDDGCDLQCVCEDETTGYYRCNQRCANYPSLPAGCTLTTDPNDPCCRVPVCPTPAPYVTQAPGLNPTTTLAPGMTPAPATTLAPGMTPPTTPGPVPTLGPAVINGQGVTPTPVPGVTTLQPPTPVCVYNGKSYTQGQTWQDGCQYNCECVDSMTGQYRCTQRCPSYPSLPANCRLVTSQSDSCCKEPVCVDPPTTQAPVPVTTKAPNTDATTLKPPTGSSLIPDPIVPQPTMAPNPYTTQSPVPLPKQMCVMNGKQYTQGQQWNDGCDKICVCDDASTGHYTCNERCKAYDDVPKECTMVPDPNDPLCCQIPQCIPVPGTDGNPTPGPTDQPVIYTNAPHAVVTGTGTPPTPVPGTTVSPLPGQTTPPPTPAPAVCVYKGVQYVQGQRWQDGCNYDCVCDDGVTGKYTCTARCGDYPNLPRQCQLQRDPNDYCCYVPVCDWSATTPVPNPNPTPNPVVTVSPVPGQTTVAPNPTPIPAPKALCVYNGVTFAQGQTISDGCSKTCRCDDASTNYYNCYDRCASYPSVPDGCIMVTDPSDSCCQIPQCYVNPTPSPNTTPAPQPQSTLPGQTPNPNMSLTPAPAVTPAPSPIPTAVPGQIVNNPDPTRPPSQKGFCVYNGMKYTTGQAWDDGCNYHCVCLDDQTGQYRCTEKCAKYTSIPTYCVMVTDPNDQCCKVPYCPNVVPTPAPSVTPAPNPNLTPGPGSTLSPNPENTPSPNPTQAPNPNPNPVSTPAPQPLPKDVCVMNDKAYTQGQQWYDDCKQICVCDDASTGHYTCNERCATYSVGSLVNCVYVPDPNDPVCCQIPQCTQTNSTVPEPITGTHTGGGSQPTPRPPTTVAPIPGSNQTPAPGQTLAPNPNPTSAPTPAPKACVYKGNTYTQGQSWRDGCSYDCTCTDAENGKYTCTDICPAYPGLPVHCTMVRDPLNPCCQKPDCSTTAPGTTMTPVPGQSTVAPNPNPYPAPKTNFCVYKSVPLRQGEVFNDGCDLVCRCEDTMTNSVVCDERCPTYPALKPGCTMITDPNDACCRVPQCTPLSPDTNTTVIPGVPGGSITGQTQPDPTNPVTGSRDACLYQGKVYTTGQVWDDGCTYTCVCVDGMTGNYRCTEKCTRYPNVPAQCSMVQDPDDQCCQTPYCPSVAPTPAPNPNPNPNPTPGPGSTLAPGTTVAPNPLNPQPTPAPTPNVCTYKSQLYRQDQVWYDDCNAVCKCEDASTGYYRCQERCAKYTSVPSGCHLEPDPKDPTCCKVASCPIPPTSAPNPTPGYVQPNPSTPAPPMVTGIAPVPTPSSGPTPAPVPGATTPAPMPKTGCYFNGKAYNKGQQFDDGCDYTCVCVDDMTGQYQCTKRCTDYPQVLPQGCVMVQDPDDACCQKPYCDYSPTPFPNGLPTPAPDPYATPLPGVTTVAPTIPPPGFCVYKGVYYTQGQTWDDGCDKKCRCEDVQTGYYSCNDRCPVYNNLDSSCRLVTDPNDNCCLAPDCNNFTPAPTPSPIVINPGTGSPVSGTNPTTTTPAPVIFVPNPVPPAVITGTSSNNPDNTPGTSGKSNMCVYKGAIYSQGQTWDDSCDLQCECVDQMRGQYRCTEKCPRYMNLPSYCIYEQDPADPCCQKVTCNTGLIPTPQPQTPSPAMTLSPGTNPPITGTNPPITLKPGTNPPYTGSNPPITLSPGTNPPYTGSNPPITLSPGTNPPHTGSNPPITFSPGTNTPYTGTNPPITFSPGTNPPYTGTNPPATPSSMTGNRDQCVYKDNSIHPMGSQWQDGCKTCVCEDPTSNSYKCSERCPVYSDLPSSCFLTEDPNDACCKIPQCSGTLQPITATGTQPTGTSGSNVVPIGTHQTFTGSGNSSSIPGGTSGSRSVCVYKGTVHNQGESWDDGCDYTCTCEDASTSLYKCTSKCPDFPTSLPSYCTMNTVPGMCCKAMTCNIPTLGNYNPAPQLNPTPAPTLAPGATPTPSSSLVIYPSGTQPVIGGGNQYPGNGYALPSGVTSGSVRNQCVYKQKIYNHGETWDDGCDYTCECKDATTGYYECRPQCARYTLPQGCYTVKPAGQCCEQPICARPDGTEFNPLTNPDAQYPVYGSYQPGITGFRPGYSMNTGSSSVTGTSNQCNYKGQIYQQGQRWDDGCDFTCECTDASKGLYSCTPLCPTYTNLPSVCHMVTLPGQCCQEPRCSTSTISTMATPNLPNTPSPTVSGCVDAIDNCQAYGQSACQDPYLEWATQNCKAFCGFCATTTSATSNDCADKLSNCDAYGQDACVGEYEPWAKDNCEKTCNLCPTTPSPYVTNYPQVTSACADKLSNCDQYDKATSCVDPYTAWATENCQKYCDLCPVVGGNYGTTISGTMGQANWLIMMKGVSGVSGDLYNLWTGTGTSNENVPEAMYLTNQYKGHYKPDLSNYWQDFCIDKVKLAVFKNGVEKANIIFDATGADKNSWFDKNRIISSTWTDISSAPSNIFSLLGDPSTGREFEVSSSGSGCNVQGWIMVSTQNTCSFEQTSTNGIYYAPGQNSINFANTQPASADVIAVLAHSKCPGATAAASTIVNTSKFCIYKSNIYTEGETWQDGCQYNCTCIDGLTGTYRCVDMCPVWDNLPTGCELVQNAGSCCSVVQCGNRTNIPNEFCSYGDNIYLEGETWKDGCKYNCECKDGATGFYECQTMCLQWNLPSQCHLDPPPAGKCCEVPVCPANIQIQYPPGYVQQ